MVAREDLVSGLCKVENYVRKKMCSRYSSGTPTTPTPTNYYLCTVEVVARDDGLLAPDVVAGDDVHSGLFYALNREHNQLLEYKYKCIIAIFQIEVIE